MSLLFFFKQKTAYELRISDWSSDGCSSDLSLIALAFLIWAVATRQMAFDQRSASTIFVEGEEGHPDDASVAPESDERVPHPFDTARAGLDAVTARSEERCVGKACVGTCRSRGSPYHYKKTNQCIRIK